MHRLVTRRLFGVDRNPAAVRLTEMRLWLEVLRATRGSATDRVRPLPNLDAAIRAGDALLDPELPPLGTRLVQRLRVAQLRVAGAHGNEKRARLRALQRAEAAALVEALGEREASLDRAIRDLVFAQRAPSLFGDVTPVRAADRRQLTALHDAHRAVRRELRRVASGTAALPFALTTAFAPVLSVRGGFDLVVGNPPWVRAERIPADTRRALAARYRWWRTTRTAGYAHAPDLSVAFVERAMSLLAPEGTLALLVPAKLSTATYATAARAALGAASHAARRGGPRRRPARRLRCHHLSAGVDRIESRRTSDPAGAARSRCGRRPTRAGSVGHRRPLAADHARCARGGAPTGPASRRPGLGVSPAARRQDGRQRRFRRSADRARRVVSCCGSWA